MKIALLGPFVLKYLIMPGEELLESLELLRTTLNQLRERLENSGVERTNGLKTALGNDCKFYRKSLDMFLTDDYSELRDLIVKCSDLFLLIEGPSDV